VRVAVDVPGVPPDAAWAWWTDFRPGSEDHAFAAWAHPERRVEFGEAGRVVLTETARVWRFRFLEVAELELKKPRVKFDVRNNFGRFWGHYRFLPAADGGTRLEGPGAGGVVAVDGAHRQAGGQMVLCVGFEEAFGGDGR
jgi:hypothetical protein